MVKMLKIKHLTLFEPKNWKKADIFYQGCKKNRVLLDFFSAT